MAIRRHCVGSEGRTILSPFLQALVYFCHLRLLSKLSQTTLGESSNSRAPGRRVSHAISAIRVVL